MKKLLLLLVAVTLVFTACNKEKKEKDEVFVSKEAMNKNVVLEEFTGQNCGYCPDGHKRANEILAAHEGHFFPIVIHGGYLSKPEMQCDDAKAIQSFFAPPGVPYGVINRGWGVENRGAWSAKTAQALAEPAYLNVAAKGTIETATRTLKLKVQVYYTANSEKETNYLSVAMLQNNIEASQSNGNTNPSQMLRDIINEDTWGDAITPTTTGTLIEKEYTYIIPDKVGNFDVDLNNLEFVAFVAERQNNLIINACEAQITKK